MADKMTKTVVKNVSDGPKVLNAVVPMTLQAGESTNGDVEISEAELEMAKLTEWFSFGAKAKPETKAE